MSLKEKLQEDWKTALKSKDSFKASVLSMARAAILQREKTDGSKLSDEEVIDVLSKEVKQRKESIADFEKGNRQDLVEQTQNEVAILLDYLPQQLTEQEIEEIVKSAVNEVGASSMKDMGKVMSAIMPHVKGRSDGKTVSRIVKQFLK